MCDLFVGFIVFNNNDFWITEFYNMARCSVLLLRLGRTKHKSSRLSVKTRNPSYSTREHAFSMK